MSFKRNNKNNRIGEKEERLEVIDLLTAKENRNQATEGMGGKRLGSPDKRKNKVKKKNSGSLFGNNKSELIEVIR